MKVRCKSIWVILTSLSSDAGVDYNLKYLIAMLSGLTVYMMRCSILKTSMESDY